MDGAGPLYMMFVIDFNVLKLKKKSTINKSLRFSFYIFLSLKTQTKADHFADGREIIYNQAVKYKDQTDLRNKHDLCVRKLQQQKSMRQKKNKKRTNKRTNGKNKKK